MRMLRIAALSLVSLGLVFSAALAKHHTPEDRGKTLFNDSTFAGGSKACNDCHPGGKGVEKASAKGLENVVNNCIRNGNGGKPIDPKSDQMKDIIAYIKSLGKKPAGGY